MTNAAGRTDEAVLALHLQNDVLHPDGKVALGISSRDGVREGVIAACGRLLDGARTAGIPVVSVRIVFRPDYSDIPAGNPMFESVRKAGAMAEGSWGTHFLEGLEPREGEHVVTHNRVNGFYDSPLSDVLDILGARHLYLCGVATNSVVEHTARHAADAGFMVTCVEDACASARADLHDAALENIRLIGNTMTTMEVVRAWRAHCAVGELS